ncbi:hypothetical protein G6F36_015653 [Rhizopus arrhizus]|nr:hypothetical protein G6F36_015653 [Rhizopus arrhizus]
MEKDRLWVELMDSINSIRLCIWSSICSLAAINLPTVVCFRDSSSCAVFSFLSSPLRFSINPSLSSLTLPSLTRCSSSSRLSSSVDSGRGERVAWSEWIVVR